MYKQTPLCGCSFPSPPAHCMHAQTIQCCELLGILVRKADVGGCVSGIKGRHGQWTGERIFFSRPASTALEKDAFERKVSATLESHTQRDDSPAFTLLPRVLDGGFYLFETTAATRKWSGGAHSVLLTADDVPGRGRTALYGLPPETCGRLICRFYAKLDKYNGSCGRRFERSACDVAILSIVQCLS